MIALIRNLLFLATCALAFLLTACTDATQQSKSDKEFEIRVGWSVWTGWMPFELMDKEGFLEARAKEMGVRVKLIKFNGYMESIEAFKAGKIDGCTMTSMEALQPAADGIPSVAVLVNDLSHGGDGILVRNLDTLAELEGKEILLEKNSVSHYLLHRALVKNGIDEKKVKIKNTPSDKAGKVFLTDDSIPAVATWNPYLFFAREQEKGQIIFDSADIPGEIIDLLIVNRETCKENPLAVKALVLAWYDAMKLITNPSTREKAIQTMAEAAGATDKEFNAMLGGTNLFTDPSRAARFLKSPELEKNMFRIREFSSRQALISNPDLSIGFGSGSEAPLSFDPSFVEAAEREGRSVSNARSSKR